jgi:hypothetical protein
MIRALPPSRGIGGTLLVHAQHQSPLGRVEVQADDVTDLVHEQWIGGELERLRAW